MGWGHGFDEDMLRDPKHPRHTSGGREGFMAFFIVAICAVIFWSSVDVAWMSSFLKTLLTLALSLAAAVLVGRWIAGAAKRHKARMQKAIDEERAAERERQMAAFKSREAGRK